MRAWGRKRDAAVVRLVLQSWELVVRINNPASPVTACTTPSSGPAVWFIAGEVLQVWELLPTQTRLAY